ncbi:MAG: peptidase domain-containing protein [Halobacteriota archaeon]
MKIGWVCFVGLAVLLMSVPVGAIQVEPETIYDTITEGETDWFSRDISSSTFDVYLVWDDPSDSLTLTIHSPDGSDQTFRDGDDGKVDGKIILTIRNAEQGQWYFEVYGEEVSGVEDYSFSVY